MHINGLELQARVGVPDNERATPQRLVAYLTFWPIEQSANRRDDIHTTVDYSAVSEETKRFVATRSDKLIETTADRLAAQLLKKFSIQKIVIEIRKFALPDADFTAVTVTRERKQN